MRSHRLIPLAATLALCPGMAGAHSGGLDPLGCHYEGRAYHCHRAARANRTVNAPVKKSRENVCHGTTSPNYRTIKYFIAFETMAGCIKSGGRALGAR